MKVHLPWSGKATGSSANLIYQSYWGNTYTRSFPFSFHYPDTGKQQKCQQDFFKIQRVWWEVYKAMAPFIPKSQRHNKNIYNLLSAGIYRIFMTYSEKKQANVVPVWGLDNRKTVKLSLFVGPIDMVSTPCTVYTEIQSIQSSRKFQRIYNHLLLVNVTQQSFYYTNFKRQGTEIKETFTVPGDWQPSDLILCYLALSDESFFTNFYLCAQ